MTSTIVAPYIAKSAGECSVQTWEVDGVKTVALVRPGCTEWFLTARLRDGESAGAFFGRLACVVLGLGAGQIVRVVDLRIFGLAGAATTEASGGDYVGSLAHGARRELVAAFGEVDWPVTWLDEGAEAPRSGDGAEKSRPSLGGALLHAVAGPAVRRLGLDGRPVGTVFEDEAARFCVLGDLRAGDAAATRPEQARQVLESMPALLAQAGMDFSHVARTWFWNDCILTWYKEFNQVRSEFFRRHGVFDRMLPASTGIGGSNAADAALTAGVLALDSPDPDVRVESVPSPLQCPAYQYGSAFSRAVEMALPGHRRLTISGTASIAPEGQTVHVGDVAGQIALTMRVLEALLESRGMDWSDVCRAIVYLRRAEDAPAFEAYCAAHGLEGVPVVVTHMVVCRPDLLFEMELDAIQADE